MIWLTTVSAEVPTASGVSPGRGASGPQLQDGGTVLAVGAGTAGEIGAGLSGAGGGMVPLGMAGVWLFLVAFVVGPGEGGVEAPVADAAAAAGTDILLGGGSESLRRGPNQGGHLRGWGLRGVFASAAEPRKTTWRAAGGPCLP